MEDAAGYDTDWTPISGYGNAIGQLWKRYLSTYYLQMSGEDLEYLAKFKQFILDWMDDQYLKSTDFELKPQDINIFSAITNMIRPGYMSVADKTNCVISKKEINTVLTLKQRYLPFELPGPSPSGPLESLMEYPATRKVYKTPPRKDVVVGTNYIAPYFNAPNPAGIPTGQEEYWMPDSLREYSNRDYYPNDTASGIRIKNVK